MWSISKVSEMIAVADTFFCIATSKIGSYYGLVASGKNARYDRVVSGIPKTPVRRPCRKTSSDVRRKLFE